MYDNTKLEAAFAEWLKNNVTVGFGEHYSGDLLADFDNFLRTSKMMKRSPGRVAFGKLLNSDGRFETRKRYGLTHWSGLELNTLPKADALEPRRYKRTKEAEDDRHLKVSKIREEAEFQESPKAEAARLAHFKAELETETPESIRKVGHEHEEM
jgi:hypothetical protein